MAYNGPIVSKCGRNCNHCLHQSIRTVRYCYGVIYLFIYAVIILVCTVRVHMLLRLLQQKISWQFFPGAITSESCDIWRNSSETWSFGRPVAMSLSQQFSYYKHFELQSGITFELSKQFPRSNNYAEFHIDSKYRWRELTQNVYRTTNYNMIQLLCCWKLSIILFLSKNTVLFIWQNTTFRRLDSVSTSYTSFKDAESGCYLMHTNKTKQNLVTLQLNGD
jgi:hypothetical protein